MKQYQLTAALICISIFASPPIRAEQKDLVFKEIPPIHPLTKISNKIGQYDLAQTNIGSDTTYCRGIINSNTYIEVIRNIGQTDKEACEMAGFREPLEKLEVNAIKESARSEEVKRWTLSESVSSDNLCDPTLTDSQRNLLKSVKDIKSKISCQKYISLGNKESAQAKGKVDLTKLAVSNQLEACSCISKETPALKVEESFEKEYNKYVADFIGQEYIAKLYNARLYQYSLGSHIFSDKDLNLCTELIKNKELQKKAKGKDDNTTRISQLISPIGPKEAYDLYNIKQDVKKTPPVISQAAFKKFAQDWSIMTHPQSVLNKGRKSDEIVKDALDTLKKMHSDKANFEVSTAHFTEIAGATEQKGNKEKELKLADEITYLEKILTTKLGQTDKTLLEQIVDSFKENPNPQKPEIAFEEIFKKLTSEYMNEQCAINQLIINPFLDGDFSSISFHPKLISSLAANMPDQKDKLEKYHCATLQRILETDPENFLIQVCDSMGGTLPPTTCPSIGEFIRSRFIEKKQIQRSTSLKETLLADTSLDGAISKQAKAVRSEHSTTFSSFVNEASQNVSSFANNNRMQVKMSDYDIDKTSAYTSHKSGSVDPYNEQGPIAARNTQELQSANASMNMNTYHQNAVLPHSNQLSTPVITYDNRVFVTPTPAPTLIVESNTTAKPAQIESPLLANDEESDNTNTKLKKVKKKKKKIIETIEEEEEEEMTTSPKGENSIFSSNARSTSGSTNRVGSQSVVPSFTAPISGSARSSAGIPEESAQQYVEARRFEKGLVYHKDSFDNHADGMVDSSPPETGVMLNAFRTGKISGKDVTRIALGDEIKDVKSFEQTNTYHGPVVIVEDKNKNERYICRAFVTDAKDGVDRLLPLEAKTPGKDELGGYKCTTDKAAPELKTPISETEKREAQKVIAGNERLYKAFVLDKIVKQSKVKKEVPNKN